MNQKEIAALMQAVSVAVGERMEKLLDRIEALEARQLIPGQAGKDGAPGVAGKDGLGIEDFDVNLDGDGVLLITLSNGERRVSKRIELPVIRDAGVWRMGASYGKGSGVTYAGSLWIAQAETRSKPGEGADWRLAVKRGKDGRDATLAA